MYLCLFLLLSYFFSFYVYLSLRDCKQRRIRERGQSIRAGSVLTGWQQGAPCGARTHKLWDHDLSRSWMFNWLSYSGAPVCSYSFLKSLKTVPKVSAKNPISFQYISFLCANRNLAWYKRQGKPYHTFRTTQKKSVLIAKSKSFEDGKQAQDWKIPFFLFWF